MPIAQVRDINLFYEVYGTGEPLLLIHGLGLDSRAWASQIAALSQTYQVIVFDNRGAGRSDAPATIYSTEQMAEDTIALLNLLAIDRVHVLGFSMGGLVAQVLALKYPTRVKSLLLVSTAARLPAMTQQVIQGWTQLLKEKIRPGTRMRLQLPWLFTDRFLQDSTQVDNLIEVSLHYPYQSTTHGFAGQVAACVSHNTLSHISQLSSTTLVLGGREDILIPAKASQELARKIPNATLQIVEGAAHNFFLEMPDRFNQVVLHFLNWHMNQR